MHFLTSIISIVYALKLICTLLGYATKFFNTFVKAQGFQMYIDFSCAQLKTLQTPRNSVKKVEIANLNRSYITKYIHAILSYD